MTEYVDLLDKITKDRTLPTGYDGWLIRSVHPDLTSSNDYRYPFPGKVAKASGPFSANGNDCPEYSGDGICAAKDWLGIASGGIPAITLLLVAYRDADVLHRGGSKWRLRKLMVVDLLDGARLVREHGACANLSDADLSGANLRRAYLGGANLRRAYLGGADLYGANLSGADLYDAYLGGANLGGADLSGADLGHWRRGANGYAERVG